MAKGAESQIEQVVSRVDSDLDIKGDSQDRLRAQEFANNWRDGTAEEKKLVRKLDWRILVSRRASHKTLLTYRSHVLGFSTS